MENQNDTGVFQMDNGCWGYRYKINIDGTLKEKRRPHQDRTIEDNRELKVFVS